MARYKVTSKGQGQFMQVNLEAQLLPGTFEWTVDYLVNKAELFDQQYSKNLYSISSTQSGQMGNDNHVNRG